MYNLKKVAILRSNGKIISTVIEEWDGNIKLAVVFCSQDNCRRNSTDKIPAFDNNQYYFECFFWRRSESELKTKEEQKKRYVCFHIISELQKF